MEPPLFVRVRVESSGIDDVAGTKREAGRLEPGLSNHWDVALKIAAA
jgi:hypothetical protein